MQALAPIIDQAIRGVRGPANALGVEIKLWDNAGPATLDVDAGQLARVLSKLLSNAVRFSPAGSTVALAISRTPGKLRISVADRGPGVPVALRPLIFQTASAEDVTHAGLPDGRRSGLGISRMIIENMGGTIGCVTSDSEGSTFFVEFPAADAGLDWVPAPPRDFGRRVLVCVEDPDTARLLEQMLVRHGFQVAVAHAAAQAKAALAAGSFDVVILDLLLRGQHGLSLLRELRDDHRTAGLPVVVISATIEQGALAVSGEFEAVDWLSKPAGAARLPAVVRRFLATCADRKPRVLCVGADADLRQLTGEACADSAAFDFAADLATARTKLADDEYSLVILELALPDGSGWELLPVLRQLVPLPPVVVLSEPDAGMDEWRGARAALVESRLVNYELVSRLKSMLKVPGSGPDGDDNGTRGT